MSHRIGGRLFSQYGPIPRARGRRPQAATPHHLARAITPVVILLAAFPGCTADQRPAPDTDGPAGTLRITWIHPAEGDLLSDTLRCRVRIDGGPAVRAGLEADDSPAVERTVEPWTFCWLPPDTSSTGSTGERAIRLRVAALDRAGIESTSDVLLVRWIPNGVPRLRLLGAESPAWIERAAGESLRVEAIDPEDGPLSGTSILWRSDLEGTIGQGACLPAAALIPGGHLLSVRATDRWLRSASLQIVAEAFDYSDRRNPAAALDDIRHALLDRRVDRYTEALAGEFHFIFCPADRETDPETPVRWNADSEAGFVRRCLSDEGTRFLRVDWTVASLQRALLDGEEGAKAEIAAVEIRLAALPRDTLVVASGEARVYMRRDSASGIWRLVQWQDLGAAGATTQGRLRLELSSDVEGARAPRSPAR